MPFLHNLAQKRGKYERNGLGFDVQEGAAGKYPNAADELGNMYVGFPQICTDPARRAPVSGVLTL